MNSILIKDKVIEEVPLEIHETMAKFSACYWVVSFIMYMVIFVSFYNLFLALPAKTYEGVEIVMIYFISLAIQLLFLVFTVKSYDARSAYNLDQFLVLVAVDSVARFMVIVPLAGYSVIRYTACIFTIFISFVYLISILAQVYTINLGLYKCYEVILSEPYQSIVGALLFITSVPSLIIIILVMIFLFNTLSFIKI